MNKTIYSIIFGFVVAFLAILILTVKIYAAGTISFISLAWDANTEPDLAGYKIYYGKISRFMVDQEIKDAITKKCETAQDIQGCTAQMEEFCIDDSITIADPACHSSLYNYDTMLDVGNVTEYTIPVLPDGTYYFAATAYDGTGNESKFSKELNLTIDNTAPNIVIGLRATQTREMIYRLYVEEIIETE
jgi:hypothetical protein